ncbi:MAG: hypothetical protein JXQ75_21390 [Phycisphaerae bacterium]|nr:hypothetical protein [Phycisphaerae bacterium]
MAYVGHRTTARGYIGNGGVAIGIMWVHEDVPIRLGGGGVFVWRREAVDVGDGGAERGVELGVRVGSSVWLLAVGGID